MNDLKGLSRDDLIQLHERNFKIWEGLLKRIESLQKEEVKSYRESVLNSFVLKETILLEKEYHERLKKIDEEMQVRIWEGKID